MVRTGIHIFRKDLRTEDNLALNQLAKSVDQIVGVFIFDPKQIDQTNSNKSHRSLNAAQFIVDSVNDLYEQCNKKLIIAYGNPITTIHQLISYIQPVAVSFNADFTPYSLKRDEGIRKLCVSYDIECIINSDDQCLARMDSLVKKDGNPYVVFGTFYKHLIKQTIPTPTTKKVKWTKPKVDLESLKWKNIESVFAGGREEAMKILKNKPLAKAADVLDTETSHLSAYLNQGCVSIREVYAAFKRHNAKESIRSIAWRDFFLCIYRFLPNGNSYTQFIDERYNDINWPKLNQSHWKRFMQSDTGFLMIDAIMAELLQTGYINNRARLLLATFWIKYLMINPFDKEYGSQEGFSRLLIDCSSSQNKLNHQWVIGDLDFAGRRFGMKGTHPLTGRMIRVDNDLIKKFDPNYTYISKWLPQFQGKSLKECKSMMKDTKQMYEWRDRYKEYAKLFKSIEK